MRLTALALLCALPFPAFAAGSDDSEPPPETKTTTECKKGEVWDEKTKACIAADGASVDDDLRFGAARELAWVGRHDEALVMLSLMAEGDTDRVMTYKGFALRKSGRVEEGIAAYEAALALNPDNILARSYYGQLFVEMAEADLALAQLEEIRARGGAGTWAETALAAAIKTGTTYSY